MDIQVGDIVFSGKRKAGFYSKSVMFFTESRWSHCFFIMTDVANEKAVLEADLKCQVVPWQREYEINDNDYYEVFRPIKASEEEKINSANRVYREYSGEEYGFLQIPWFVWDSICKKIGWSSGKNWFPSGAICSEVQVDYIQGLNVEYDEAYKDYQDLNRVSPEDSYQIVINRPDLFKFVGKRL
jgi:hypothetical protein